MENILLYDSKQLPAENIKIFRDEVHLANYELFKDELNGNIEYLQNKWKNDVHLRDIVSKFQIEFQEHLQYLSINETNTFNYVEHLETCKQLLKNILLDVSPSYQNVLIISKIDLQDNQPSQLKLFEDLNPDLQKQIMICHEILQKFFESLKEIVTDEILYCARVAISKANASFIWQRSKVDFSELILFLISTNSLKMKDGSILNKTTLIKELSALFGIEKNGYNQDIDKILYKYREKSEETFLHQGTIEIINRAKQKYE